MKKLTKIQQALFLASAISIVLDYLIANSGAIGISAKIVPLISLLKLLYDQYQSFSAQNMVEFGDEMANKPKISAKGSGLQPRVSDADLENYKLSKK